MPRAGNALATRGLVRCDGASILAVEAFLSEATGAVVRLGEVWLATARLGRAIAGAGAASALTLGQVIFLSGDASAGLRRAAGGRGRLAPGTALEALGPLLVHECVHVWQYRRTGTSRFLLRYLADFAGNYVRSVGRTTRPRLAAYLAIAYEREAFGLEAEWRHRTTRD